MTDNHDYNTPERGTADWHSPLNKNFERIDRDVEVRDSDSNKGSYEPKEGAKFFATDTGNVYLGDGSSWNPVNVGTSSENASFQSVNATDAFVNSRQADVVVYQDGDTTKAVGRNEIVASGSNPSAVIQQAIENGRYIEITGDYVLNDEITVTQNNRTIDARSATFTAGGDTKLWHFEKADLNEFYAGICDLGTEGRVAVDLHAAWSNTVQCYLKDVPDGTFEETDDNTTGTYDRVGVRLKGMDGGSTARGTYYNDVSVKNDYRSSGQKGTGIGLQCTTTDGAGAQPGNANLIHAKLTGYGIGVHIDPGSGNVFQQLDVSHCNRGIVQRPGEFGAFNDAFGMVWAEHCNTCFDVASGNGRDCKFGIFGRYSNAGSDQTFTNRKSMFVVDYFRGELLCSGMTLKDYNLG